jgi:hypothetical protein
VRQFFGLCVLCDFVSGLSFAVKAESSSQIRFWPTRLGLFVAVPACFSCLRNPPAVVLASVLTTIAQERALVSVFTHSFLFSSMQIS